MLCKGLHFFKSYLNDLPFAWPSLVTLYLPIRARLFTVGTGKSEPWEDGFKRRVVKTTKPEHLDKGYKWRIKGKDRDEISIKLYKSKPDFAEFKKQMKRVAGHEFGG